MRKFTGEFSTRATGSEYEELAANCLMQNGYRILKRNYRCHAGEIDLIAKDGEYLCFVEVKYRKTDTFGGALAAVNTAKQQRICRSALFYLTQNGYTDTTPCRFDVVGVTPKGVQIMKDAFTFHT